MLTNADPTVSIQVKEMLLWQRRKGGKRLVTKGRSAGAVVNMSSTLHAHNVS